MMEPETGGPDAERIYPVAPVLEQVRFLRIVQAETTPQGRLLIDWWVCPHDVYDGNTAFLERTFELLWRTDERQESND